MNEIGFYNEFSKRFSQYLISYLEDKTQVYYSCNKTLDRMLEDLEYQSGAKLIPDDEYIPKLKLDIVFAVMSPSRKPRLILIEAKYLYQLSLKDYSQLVGYLQVAKSIDIGILLLIQKGSTINKLSSDFQEIVRLKKLPMSWIIDIQEMGKKFSFQTGILNYVPSNGIDWVDTTEIPGISSFVELRRILES